jgi:hypothetical protein
MNLYLISQNENRDYDTYDSAIVAAVDEDAARNTHPGGAWRQRYDTSWCKSPEAVNVELIGVAAEGIEPGVVLASFNAG